jgi:outer membrane protein assembly factor BamB
MFAINDGDALLRRLATDSDLEIRRLSLTRLNDHLRVSLSATPGSARIVLEADRDNRIKGLCFLGDSLVVAFRNGEVGAFDAQSLRNLWTRRVFSGAGSQMLAGRDRVFLASRVGGVIALDNNGHVVWNKETDDDSNEIRRLVFHGNELLLVRLNSVDRLDTDTGVTKSTVLSHGLLTDADSTDSTAFFIDGHGLHSLNDPAALPPNFSGAVGISVNQQSVCVTSTAPEDRITCLGPDSLSLQWTQRIGKHGTWGHGVAPIQNGSQVFVPTDTELTAFNAADGSMQWTAYGGQESHDTTVATDYGLLVQSITYKLELRDLQSGEVRRVWPQVQGVARIAVHEHFAAVTDLDGRLWVVSLRN